MAELYRILQERFGRSDKQLDGLIGKTRETKQRLADLQYEARQPRLNAEADVQPDPKTCKRTEGAAADRSKHGDSSFARVNDGPTSLTTFGVIVEPRLLAPEKCIGDALVNKGAEAPMPHFPLVKVRMLSSTTGGLLPTDTTSAMMGAIFPPPPSSWSLVKETKEKTDRTNFNQLAPPSWRKVVQTKLRQNLVFDPGGCSSHLRGYPFLGGRHALLCGGFVGTLRWYLRMESFC